MNIKKILIVEDNPINAELLKEMLDQMQVETTILLNGSKVFSILEEQDFDLILLDIMMPEISGYEIMERISKSPKTKNIPVIFVSALSETKDLIKGLELGCYDYITKPYKIDELKAKVQNVLRIKELQDKLKNEKETLEKIYTYAADGIVTIDKDYCITSCSQSFASWFEASPKELKSECFCKLMQCKNKLNSQKCLTSTTLTNDKIQDLEFEDKTLELKGSHIKNTKGETEGHIIVLRDVTKLREIEKQKETFIATLTHDLKTPVRAEIRAIELLLDGHFGDLNQDQSEILKEVLNSSNYMFTMIDSLVARYKYEDNKVVLEKSYFDINEAINKCLKEAKVLYQNKHQTINISSQTLTKEIYADYIEIKRALTNLLTNAIKYSEENSIIEIKIFEQQGNMNISFIDNGPGISEDERKAIFDKYVSYSKKFRKVGSGLGLYITKKIALMHGGDISVQSKEGEGSNFTLSMPIQQTLEIEAIEPAYQTSTLKSPTS